MCGGVCACVCVWCAVVCGCVCAGGTLPRGGVPFLPSLPHPSPLGSPASLCISRLFAGAMCTTWNPFPFLSLCSSLPAPLRCPPHCLRISSLFLPSHPFVLSLAYPLAALLRRPANFNFFRSLNFGIIGSLTWFWMYDPPPRLFVRSMLKSRLGNLLWST